MQCPRDEHGWANQQGKNNGKNDGHRNASQCSPELKHQPWVRAAEVSFLLGTHFSPEVDFGSVALSFSVAAPQPSSICKEQSNVS